MWRRAFAHPYRPGGGTPPLQRPVFLAFVRDAMPRTTCVATYARPSMSDLEDAGSPVNGARWRANTVVSPVYRAFSDNSPLVYGRETRRIALALRISETPVEISPEVPANEQRAFLASLSAPLIDVDPPPRSDAVYAGATLFQTGVLSAMLRSGANAGRGSSRCPSS